MRFDILTLFPQMFSNVLDDSIIGRAQRARTIEIHCHQIRDWARDKHSRVDDILYGGGFGMLMIAPPIYDCWRDVSAMCGISGEKTRTVYMTPQGRVLTQKRAEELAGYERLIVLCGHYEGVDARVLEEIGALEISVGDYVLTGGELPAAVLVDCVARLVPGVLADEKCHADDSISSGLLEYPQYARPQEFRGREVPEVLLSGHHANIERWRRDWSLEKTWRVRPDMIKALRVSGGLSERDERFLAEILSGDKEVLAEGGGLVIRKARIDDIGFMCEAELHGDNSPWVGHWPPDFRNEKFGDRDVLQMIVESKDGGAVGFIIFIDMLNPKEKIQLKRIVITEKGKGYGKEALRLSQRLAFEVFGTKRLYLGTKAANIRAQTIYKAVGFIADTPDTRTNFHIGREDYFDVVCDQTNRKK